MALVERMAGVYNQLQFYVSKAKGLPFLSTVEDVLCRSTQRRSLTALFEKKQRIARITTVLRNRLEGDFDGALRNGAVELITSCLRTYALIDLRPEAEALYRRRCVAPFCATGIAIDALLDEPGHVISSSTAAGAKGLAKIYDEIIAFVRLDRAGVFGVTRNVLQGAEYDFLAHGTLCFFTFSLLNDTLPIKRFGQKWPWCSQRPSISVTYSVPVFLMSSTRYARPMIIDLMPFPLELFVDVALHRSASVVLFDAQAAFDASTSSC